MAGKRGQAANDPEKQKPVIHSCGCNKPVPSCAVCLKPMDMLNPFLELKRQQNNQGINVSINMNMGMGGLPLMTGNKFGSQGNVGGKNPIGQGGMQLGSMPMQLGTVANNQSMANFALGAPALGAPPASTSSHLALNNMLGGSSQGSASYASMQNLGAANANQTAASKPQLQIENPLTDIKLNQALSQWMTWC